MKDLLVMLTAALVAMCASAQSVAPGAAPKDSRGDVRNTPGAGSHDSASSHGAAEGRAAPAKVSKPTAKMTPGDKSAAIRSADKSMASPVRCPAELPCTRGSDGSLRGPVGDFGPLPGQRPRAPIRTPERTRP